jgi:hypothetical protein
MARRTYAPSESEEQAALFEWAKWRVNIYPELKLLYHIPNGGKREKATARRLKTEGVKPGVPDICLPVARRGYHGLYIELKARGKPTAGQLEWIDALNEQGYAAAVCCGMRAAVDLILKYLHGKEIILKNGIY